MFSHLVVKIHQTLSVIETLATVAGTLVSQSEYPEGSQHLAALLNLTLAGIGTKGCGNLTLVDPNDSDKTKATIKFYYRTYKC